VDIRIDYDPNKWAREFHESREEFPCLAGGLGSGKSYAAIKELEALAIENPGFTYLIARKTMPSLRDTTFKTFLQAIHPALIKKTDKTNMVWTLINNSEFIFRGLDDMEKFKSLEIAGGFVDEANEIDRPMFDTLKGRVRQKVNKCEPTMYRFIIALNPGEDTDWIPTLYLHEKPPGHRLFTSTTIDNLHNLPKNYLANLEATYTKDVQQRMIWGLFGRVHKGRPVFPQFQRGGYISPIQFDPESPLIRGWDFGYNHPVCIFAQMKNQQFRVLGEVLGNEIYLPDFIKQKVFPYQQQIFGTLKVRALDFCDPRGSDESDKGQTSVSILVDHGYAPIFRRTKIEEGLKILNQFMDTIDPESGLPNYQIHPRCKNLIEGCNGGYHRIAGEEKPDKDNVYDNAQDAQRYAALHAFQRSRMKSLMNTMNSKAVYVNKFTGRRVER
jgi:hypothetical protein